MIVADLTPSALRQRLRGPGLTLHTGPVSSRIRSASPSVAEGIALHYAAHAVPDDGGFVDFHVQVDRPRNLRRWFGPQVVFRFDASAPFAPLPADQAFPMLEWGLNWCVSSHCHQFLILHAAVVERDGRALILPAPSGSGKSTLCAGLVYGGGWRLLSDELTLIEPRTGLVVPLPRPVSLKNASIDAIRTFAPSARFGTVVNDTVKGSVVHVQPPATGIERAGDGARPAWVVLPRYAPGTPAALTRLSKARAFMTLVDNAFNYNVHGRGGFQALADLIEHADCHEFSYGGDLKAAIGIFDELLR